MTLPPFLLNRRDRSRHRRRGSDYLVKPAIVTNPLYVSNSAQSSPGNARSLAVGRRVEDQTMSRQGDFRITGRPGATVLRFMPLSEAARAFVDANVELEPSRWHEGSFAVEDRFARDFVGLLTEEGFDVLECRAMLRGQRNDGHWPCRHGVKS